ncbi:ABC transporter permease [Arthrobacter sp. W4I7]|uniref:ABC transporter permease n=1 Tax=Arthrobacter sp. W4I7 TaxID=3042296 RepID=UPI002788D481|nr:ABC transporter permease [Arthrobacter sp. W4I7]MDQ0691449.1 peptide/nickel transport system permease protein [Arthrobacter sp. W4I7]
MLRMVASRLLTALPLLFVVSFAVFMMVSLTPGDPAERLAGENPTVQQVDQIRAELRLDDPLLARYGTWVGDAVTGDLGHSFVTKEPVTAMLVDAAGPTASLLLVTLVIAVVAGVALGFVSAAREGKLVDRVSTVVASLAMSLPPFWFGMLLVMIVALGWGLFPAIGYVPPALGLGPWLQSLVLPAVALAALPTAEIALQLRNSMVDVLRRDYIVSARAKGLTPSSILFKHTLKNAAVPVVTVFGTRLAQLIGGAVTIETVFVFSGVGSLSVRSVLGRDVPVLLGIVVVTTAIVVLVNLAIDLFSTYLNPKVRA